MLHQTDLSRVDLNLLVLFDAVLAEQHVARAAGRLNLSPSAVSHGLARLRRMFNDPLFLRSPKGVVPTERGLALAQPIADILQNARKLVASAEPFDPSTSTRHFLIGAADGGSANIVVAMLRDLALSAVGIDLAFVSILPTNIGWTATYAQLDAREIDIALLPLVEAGDFADPPSRFATRLLFDENFGVAMRHGHPLANDLTLEQYCAAQHVIVSATGARDGFVDIFLKQLGLSRRIAATVPNYFMALDVVAGTDLIAATPRMILAAQAQRFGLVSAEMPIPLPTTQMHAVLPKAGLADDGLVWLLGAIARAV
jgi:DNA-binding transcriptional LysR family regulator